MMRGKAAIRSILLMDDDIDEYEIFSAAVHAIDPTIEVRYLNSSPLNLLATENGLPDLFFLDMNMPGMNGIEWLSKLRNQGFNALPIIMYSTSAQPAEIRKAYEKGATLYIQKKSNFKELIQVIADLLTLDWQAPDQIVQQHYTTGTFHPFPAN